jgi:competence protein ComEA
MDPSATPPWRVLEAPAVVDGERAAERRPVETSTVPLATIAKAFGIGAAALACGVLAIVLATGTGEGAVRVDGGAPLESSGPEVSSSGGVDGGLEVVAEIVGAVRKPGVYRLPAGSRLADLLRLAGGYGPRVDTGRAEQALNLAATVKDGDHVRVPSRDDAAAPSSAGGGGAAGQGAGSGGATTVDLNRATQAELEALPGIGPATAQKIIAAREEAPLTAIDELRSRGVLGEKTFEKLRDLLTVG